MIRPTYLSAAAAAVLKSCPVDWRHDNELHAFRHRKEIGAGAAVEREGKGGRGEREAGRGVVSGAGGATAGFELTGQWNNHGTLYRSCWRFYSQTSDWTTVDLL